jgi:adenylylsulfate kinase
MIYWFTGQPGHGKTVLATAFKEYLNNNCFHIDGDDIREIFDNKDYSEAGRRKNIELAQHLSHFLHKKGQNVIVSLVSPYKDQRDAFKHKLGKGILEYYIHTTDIRGREDFHVSNYEIPTEDFCDINTTNILPLDSLKQIISYAKLG